MASTSRGIPTGPVPEWTIREQLILASAVQRSGDQNWVSVSRAVKPLVEDVRPPDYFSQKNCALQYSAMLDKACTPKRKRSSDGAPEAVETVEEQIVRQLTEKRISELHDSIADTKEEYLALQKEIERIERGELDDQLPRLWQEIQQEIAAKEDTESKTKDATVLKLKSQPPSNLSKYQEQLKLRRQKSPPLQPQETAPRATEAGKPASGTAAEGQEQRGSVGRGTEAARQVHKMEVPPTEPAPTTPTQPPPLIIKKETLPGPAEKHVVTSPAPLLAEESPLPKQVTTPKEEPFGLPIRAGQPSTNVSLQQLASDVHIIVHQPNLALVSMAGVATTGVSAPPSSVMAITSSFAPVPPTVVSVASAGRAVGAAGKSEAVPPVATPPIPAIVPVATASGPLPLQAEKTVQVASARLPHPRVELAGVPRHEAAGQPVSTPDTIIPPAEIKPSKESDKIAPTPAQVTPETGTQPPSTSREELPQPMDTTASVTTASTKPEPVKPVPEPCVQTPTIPATVAPHLPASPPPLPPPPPAATVPIPSATVPAPPGLPPAPTATPPEGPAGGGPAPETEPATQSASLGDERPVQSPPKSEDKDFKVEPEKLPSDLKPPTPVGTSEEQEREVREVPAAEEETTEQRQDQLKKDEEDVEMASQEKPESSQEVVESREATEQPMETEEKQEPRPSSQTPEKPSGTKASSPPAIVVTEIESPKEEVARSPRSSISPPSSGGRVTRRSGTKRREAGLARETPQGAGLARETPQGAGLARETPKEEGSTQKEDQRKTPQPETHPPSEPHSPPSTGRRPRPSPSLTPLPEEEGEEDEIPIRRGRSSRTPFKKQWITRSRKRRAAEMDDLGGVSMESADFESEDEPISSQPSTAAPSPAPSQSDMDPEAVQAQRQWRKAIMLVWRHAAQHKYANLFLHPVRKDDAPGYTDVIYRPMHLYSIKRNIETGVTKTDIEFQRDMLLIFQNAFMYNSSDHEVYMMADEMKADVMENIQDYLATQAQLQLMDDSSGPKLLRSREGRRGDPHEEGVFSPAAKKRRTRADD